MDTSAKAQIEQMSPARWNNIAWPTRQDHALYWPLAIGGLTLDLWTKSLAFAHIPDHGAVDIIPGCLRLIKALNNGAAFSMFSGSRFFLVTIAAVALVVLIGVFLFGGKRTKLFTVALGLFTGGVAGNFHDRAFNGGLVRDFIDAYIGRHHWPTFNVADSLLCIAVGLLFISTFQANKREKAAAKSETP